MYLWPILLKEKLKTFSKYVHKTIIRCKVRKASEQEMQIIKDKKPSINI